jgi:hypothetical protein
LTLKTRYFNKALGLAPHSTSATPCALHPAPFFLGLWLWVVHLGIDSPEQDALIHTEPEDRFPPEGVGKHRADELRAILSPEVRDVISRRTIKLTNYRDLWKKMNN